MFLLHRPHLEKVRPQRSLTFGVLTVADFSTSISCHSPNRSLSDKVPLRHQHTLFLRTGSIPISCSLADEGSNIASRGLPRGCKGLALSPQHFHNACSGLSLDTY